MNGHPYAFAVGYFVGSHIILISFLMYVTVGAAATALVLWGRNGLGWIAGAWVFGAAMAIAWSVAWLVIVQTVFGQTLFNVYLAAPWSQNMEWFCAILGPSATVMAMTAIKR